MNAQQRAMVGVDGMFAGLKFLEKTDYEDILGQMKSWHGNPSNLAEEIARRGALLDDSKAIHALKRGMQDEFRRLINELTSGSPSEPSIQIQNAYSDSETLETLGVLVYREVLDGYVPGTLREIFAFTSLTYAVSTSLYDRRRMHDGDILSGLDRWRNCPKVNEDKTAFDQLAPKMWKTGYVATLKENSAFPNLEYSESTNSQGGMREYIIPSQGQIPVAAVDGIPFGEAEASEGIWQRMSEMEPIQQARSRMEQIRQEYHLSQLPRLGNTNLNCNCYTGTDPRSISAWNIEATSHQYPPPLDAPGDLSGPSMFAPAGWKYSEEPQPQRNSEENSQSMTADCPDDILR
ncbi:hypothetical protein QQS21_005740 [Conoideocrella luteorostrata]|uniref:Uncharacterized protein n=1 Tax=Conoideocrella luteorostrata TaxID=1105319 RepID=A0AAJ0CNU2_9HYPO|nr:hypothetical protein QQS21_005740 [Conoideocrella luteorostrata]